MLTFKDFVKSQKKLNRPADIEQHAEDAGWESTGDIKAVFLYDDHYHIFELANGFVLILGSCEYNSKTSAKLLEQHLYHYYCLENVETRDDLKAMGDAVIDFEWGSEPQIDMENSFFDLASEKFGFDLEEEQWERYALKATTEEMVAYALERI